MKTEITEERRQLRRDAASIPTLELLSLLKKLRPDLWEKSEVVGHWVWITFNEIPEPATREWLLDCGFHYNATRRAWQHACGHWSGRSPGNPRWKYQVIPAAELEPATA